MDKRGPTPLITILPIVFNMLKLEKYIAG